MSVWQRIKVIGAAILATAAALFAVLFYREKAAREKDKRKASEGARETEHAATQAMTSGQKREAKEDNDAIDDARRRRRRDHFE